MAFSGQQLRECRQVAGLSQKTLGQRIGTNRVQITNYENGHKEPRLPRLQSLALALGVRVDDLLDQRGVHVH